MKLEDIDVTGKMFEKNLAEKIKNKSFLEDTIPLLPKDISYNPQEAYNWFISQIIPRISKYGRMQ